MEMVKSTPMIEIVEEENAPLGRYGHMRDEYLRKHNNLAWTMMIVRGELEEHLQAVDRLAWEQMDALTAEMLAENPPPDKKVDFLGYVGHIEMVRMCAEEVVVRELITKPLY